MTSLHQFSPCSICSSYKSPLDPPSSKPLPQDFCYSLYGEYYFPNRQSLPFAPCKSLLRCIPWPLWKWNSLSLPTALFLVLLILSSCFLFLHNLLINIPNILILLFNRPKNETAVATVPNNVGYRWKLIKYKLNEWWMVPAWGTWNSKYNGNNAVRFEQSEVKPTE